MLAASALVVLVAWLACASAQDSNQQCILPTQFPGTCRSRASCDDSGVSTGTGTCPGAEQCCTVEKCYVRGVEGICVNPGSCTGTTHRFYCTGVGVCCTRSAAADCSIKTSSSSSTVQISGISSHFTEGDRELATLIEYCDPVSGRPCDSAIEPHSLSQVRWATPSGGAENVFAKKSGLGFLPETSTQDVPINTRFPIGTLTHYNWVVRGSTPQYVHLVVNLKVNGVSVPAFKYKLGIEETDNQLPLSGCAYPSVVVCADRIDFPDNGFAFAGDRTEGSVSFTLPGSNVKLTLELAGFKQNCDLPVLEEWYTQEKVVNQAKLYGRITRACPVASLCKDQKVIYEGGNCRCEVPLPTPAPTPLPTPKPTPVPPTKPGAPPTTTLKKTTTTPAPTTTELVIETPPPTTQSVGTPWSGWGSATAFVQPTPPPTPEQPKDSDIIVTAQVEEEEFPVLIVGAAAGGIACCALIGLLIAWLVLTSSGAAAAAAMGFGQGKNNKVQNNPLFETQKEEHFNPTFYSQPNGGAGYTQA